MATVPKNEPAPPIIKKGTEPSIAPKAPAIPIWEPIIGPAIYALPKVIAAIVVYFKDLYKSN